MSIVPVRVIAPRDNDCFFHVAAYFDGSPIDSWKAAKKVRTDIASAMARELLAPPWDDLTKLTAAILSGIHPPDGLPPALKNPMEPLGAKLVDAHGRARHDDNNVPADLIQYIVWVQFSALEVDDFRGLSHRRFEPLFKYTIWGEDTLAAVCVELLLGRPTAMYGAFGGIDISRTMENTPFIQNVHQTGAAYCPDRSCINFLNVGEFHFDAVEFYTLEQEELVLQSFQSAQAAIPDAPNQPLTQGCPYRLTAVTILDGGRAAQPDFVKWVNLPRRPAYLEVKKGASEDQFGTQLRLRLEFDGACTSDRELLIKLLPEFVPVAGYPDGNGLRRLPTAAEFANNKRYGWACFPEEAVGNHCAEQVLIAASLANAVPLDGTISVVVGGDKSVTLSGLFLPACAGLRYQVQVSNALGTLVSCNSVVTRKMLFYNPLVSASLEDHSEWFVDFEKTFQPFFLDFLPLPDAPKLKTAVVSDTTSSSSYDTELKDASGAAVSYHPYFFNLALIESFHSFELRGYKEEVRLDRLLAAGKYDLHVQGLDLSQRGRLIDVTVTLPGDPLVRVSVANGVTWSNGMITVNFTDRHKQLLGEPVAGLLDKVNVENAQAENEFKQLIMNDPGYKHAMQKFGATPDFTEAALIESFREQFAGEIRVVACPPALIATVTFTAVPVKVYSGTAGYYEPALKSCTIPVRSGGKKELMQIVIHEVGHVIGLAPDGSKPIFIDRSDFHYQERGHRGPHCWSGIKLLDTYKDSSVKGKCIMFGSAMLDIDPEKPFCPHCVTGIVLGDLGSGYLASKWNERPHQELTVDFRKLEHSTVAKKEVNFLHIFEVLRHWQDEIERVKREVAAKELGDQQDANEKRYTELSEMVDAVDDITELTPAGREIMRKQLEELVPLAPWDECEKWQDLLEKLNP